MAKARKLAPQQIRALDRLKELKGIDPFYLADASAITWHLGHRRSVDLEQFSRTAHAPLRAIQRATRGRRGIEVVDTTDVVLALRVGQVPVDLVEYPYPLLKRAVAGPQGFPVAQPLDLAVMKLAAIARRGIRRDFWDLYELCRHGVALAEAGEGYRKRFGRSEADLYAVQRALTWFEDAESDPRLPAGLTPALWKRIKAFFREEAPRLLGED